MTNIKDFISNEIDHSMADSDDRSMLTNASIPSSTDPISQVQKQVGNGNSASTAHSSSKSEVNTRKENTGRHVDVRNNLASVSESMRMLAIAASMVILGTVTIVIERCKPLILKLRNPPRSYFGLGGAIMPQNEIEQMVNELGDELVAYVTDAVNSIRNEVKQARPHENEESYQMKMVAYQELLRSVTQIMKTLTNVFSNSLTEFRRLIDQLWEDIQRAQNENEVQQHVQEFLRKTEQSFQDAVSKNIEPLFEVIETKMKLPK